MYSENKAKVANSCYNEIPLLYAKVFIQALSLRFIVLITS